MPTRILAISGSLQSSSANTALVRLADSLSNDRREVAVYDGLTELPYFNPDLDGDSAPKSVVALRARFDSADAVLIASPEYAAKSRASEECARLAGWLRGTVRQVGGGAVRRAERVTRHLGPRSLAADTGNPGRQRGRVGDR